MKARCGLEDCDCGHTIETLVEALKTASQEWHQVRVHEGAWKDCRTDGCGSDHDALAPTEAKP